MGSKVAAVCHVVRPSIDADRDGQGLRSDLSVCLSGTADELDRRNLPEVGKAFGLAVFSTTPRVPSSALSATCRPSRAPQSVQRASTIEPAHPLLTGTAAALMVPGTGQAAAACQLGYEVGLAHAAGVPIYGYVSGEVDSDAAAGATSALAALLGLFRGAPVVGVFPTAVAALAEISRRTERSGEAATFLPPVGANTLVEARFARAESDQVAVVAFTGGPCGGKTEGIEQLTAQLREVDYEVVVVRELMTRLILSGFDLVGAIGDPAAYAVLMENFFLLQIAEENFMLETARQRARVSKRQALVLVDRGLIDVYAFAAALPAWHKFCDTYRLSKSMLVKAYDFCLHWQSLAVDEQNLFAQVKQGNPARAHETVESAAAQDEALQAAWPEFVDTAKLTNSSGNFATKVAQAHSIICQKFPRRMVAA